MINKVFNEDCLEGMKRIPDGSVDFICTDLPFGCLLEKKNPWDVKLDLPRLWEQFNRVAKKNAAVALFAKPKFGAELIMSNYKNFRYEWIWEKNIGCGFLNAHKMPLCSHENILIFYQDLPTYNPQKTPADKTRPPKKGSGRNVEKIRAYAVRGEKSKTYCYVDDGLRFPRDVIKFNSIRNGTEERKHSKHPTQKPLALVEYLIRTYTNEGETVLDATIGSGTTAVAAINTRRKFIGFELNGEFYETACKRIEDALKAREVRTDDIPLF